MKYKKMDLIIYPFLLIMFIFLQVIFIKDLNHAINFPDAARYKSFIFYTDVLVLLSVAYLVYSLVRPKTNLVKMIYIITSLGLLAFMLYTFHDLSIEIIFIISVGCVLYIVALYKEIKKDKPSPK